MVGQATREIFWSVPTSLRTTMYVLLVVAVGVCLWGLAQKALFVSGGGPLRKLWPSLRPSKLNWKNFLETLFFTGKVARNPVVGFFHALIYYGFIILWIATDLVAIHVDTPFKVFQGPVYLVISFLADLAGLMLLVGLAWAYWRRYLRPNHLKSTHPKQELVMYGVLLALVILGFALEGMRIYATGFPPWEAMASPVGFLLARAQALAFGPPEALVPTGLALAYQILWAVHMINTMLFIGMIGHSKFSHMVLLPLSALITPFRRGGVLAPMNFEDESAETFGLGKFSELTPKNRFDLLACVECGRCSQVCPATLAEHPLDPQLIITKLRDKSPPKGQDQGLWGDAPLYGHDELDSCTTCGACMEECPANIEHVNLIMEAKRYKALTLGEIPPEAAKAINNIKLQGNPWGVSGEERFRWAQGQDVPVATEGKPIDYLYYVGCAGSYDRANQKVLLDTISLLKRARVDFAVIGKGEKCNGDPIRRLGDEYTFQELAIENISQINRYVFQKIVTHCPHCLHTLGKEYAQFENGRFEVIHHTELLAELIKQKKIVPQRPMAQDVTFHDPCYLGRHHGQYDAPREILKSIPGLRLREMEKSRDQALCCGMGGGNMWYELPGRPLGPNRLKDVEGTKAQKLATSCSYCLINFQSSKAQVPEASNLDIEDVATLLAKSSAP